MIFRFKVVPGSKTIPRRIKQINFKAVNYSLNEVATISVTYGDPATQSVQVLRNIPSFLHDLWGELMKRKVGEIDARELFKKPWKVVERQRFIYDHTAWRSGGTSPDLSGLTVTQLTDLIKVSTRGIRGFALDVDDMDAAQLGSQLLSGQKDIDDSFEHPDIVIYTLLNMKQLSSAYPEMMSKLRRVFASLLMPSSGGCLAKTGDSDAEDDDCKQKALVTVTDFAPDGAIDNRAKAMPFHPLAHFSVRHASVEFLHKKKVVSSVLAKNEFEIPPQNARGGGLNVILEDEANIDSVKENAKANVELEHEKERTPRQKEDESDVPKTAAVKNDTGAKADYSKFRFGGGFVADAHNNEKPNTKRLPWTQKFHSFDFVTEKKIVTSQLAMMEVNEYVGEMKEDFREKERRGQKPCLEKVISTSQLAKNEVTEGSASEVQVQTKENEDAVEMKEDFREKERRGQKPCLEKVISTSQLAKNEVTEGSASEVQVQTKENEDAVEMKEDFREKERRGQKPCLEKVISTSQLAMMEVNEYVGEMKEDFREKERRGQKPCLEKVITTSHMAKNEVKEGRASDVKNVEKSSKSVNNAGRGTASSGRASNGPNFLESRFSGSSFSSDTTGAREKPAWLFNHPSVDLLSSKGIVSIQREQIEMKGQIDYSAIHSSPNGLLLPSVRNSEMANPLPLVHGFEGIRNAPGTVVPRERPDRQGHKARIGTLAEKTESHSANFTPEMSNDNRMVQKKREGIRSAVPSKSSAKSQPAQKKQGIESYNGTSFGLNCLPADPSSITGNEETNGYYKESQAPTDGPRRSSRLKDQK